MSTLSAKILKEALDTCRLTLEDLRNFLPNQRESQDAFKAFSKWNTISETPHLSENRDFRFCHLLLKNFRKFGNLAGNTYYGLKFVDKLDEDDVKLIDFLTLLGDNGIGKSSLVDSLEYMFTGNIGEAQIRQISENQYIRNKSGEKSVKLYANNEILFVLDDENCKSFRQEYDVSNFFFSENSILKFAEYTRRNGDNSNDWFPFFCHILGLGALFDACAKDGIIDIIIGEIERTKIAISSETVSQTKKNLQNLLRDGSIRIEEKQRTYLTRLQTKLLTIKKNIQEDAHVELRDLLTLNVKTDLSYQNKFYFIADFRELYQRIERTENDAPQVNLGGKKILSGERKTESDVLQKLREGIDECVIHIKNVLAHGTGIVPIEEIKGEVQKLISKEQTNIVAEHHRTSEELEALVTKMGQLKTKILQLIHQTVVEYVDKDLIDAIKSIFDKTFITKDERDLTFDISGLPENNKILISIKDEPAHKYFNTFRYRLFCLTLQAVLNIKLMKKEDFSFPFIMDDVFYANDYRNKRELFKYFEQIKKYAAHTLRRDRTLQIIFFTHDEQIVSCFSAIFGKDSFVRLIQPEFALKFESNEIAIKGERYHNLYFKLYE